MVSQNLILNKVLNTRDLSIITLNNLTEKYFFNYKAEFLFIVNHYQKYNVVPDKIVFLNNFPDFDLQEVNEPDNYLLESLYKDYNTSYLATRFNNIKKMLENDKTDEALKYFMDSAEEVQTTKVIQPIDLLKDTSRYDHYLERTTNWNQYYISTGFPELDKIVGGIDLKNENMVIAARTGQGKTQMLVKMAVAAILQGKNIGFFEGEMSEDKLGYRVDTFLGHIKNTAINRGDLYVQQEYKKYIENLALQNNYGSFKVLTLNSAGGQVTVDTLKAFVEKEHLDMLFVDQYSLMTDTSNAKTSFERVGNIAKELKHLQVKYQIPVIAVAQMNRTKNEDKSQDTTQIGLSDLIPQYATILLMLDRDKNDPNRLTINIVKSRDGGDNKKLEYMIDWNLGKFTYIPSENDNVCTDEDLQNIADSYNTIEADNQASAYETSDTTTNFTWITQ